MTCGIYMWMFAIDAFVRRPPGAQGPRHAIVVMPLKTAIHLVEKALDNLEEENLRLRVSASQQQQLLSVGTINDLHFSEFRVNGYRCSLGAGYSCTYLREVVPLQSR